MRSPLTETFRKVQSLVDQVNALNPDEHGLFLDLLLPESEEQPKQKKTRKKRTTAQSGKQTKKGLPEQTSLMVDRPRTGVSTGELCGACGNVEDYQDHFAPSPHYHEFQPGKSKKAAGGE